MLENLDAIAKYNFWEDTEPEVGFLRTDYTSKIAGYSSDRVVKVLIGQRRVGKSYILRQVAKDLISKGVNRKNTFFVNKEYLAFDSIRTYQDLETLFQEYKKELDPEGKIYIFLDEVQEIEEWERFVNSYSQDCTAEYELFISGSNSKMLSSELGTLLSGRYVEFKIYPFSFNEYSSIRGLQKTQTNYIEYMKHGGLPELLKLSDEDARRQYVEGLKNTILLKDIIQRHKVRDTALLEDLFVYLVNNSSKLTSIQNLVNYLDSKRRKTSYETVSQYVEYLSETFVIHKAERYDIKGKEALGGNAKYYANDNSYHNYLYEGYGYGQGALLENYVYQALRRAGVKIYAGKMANREVDFVCTDHDKRLYVQVSWTLEDKQTEEREYASLEAIDDSYPKILVTMDDIPFKNRKGIENIQAWRLEEFLGL